MPKSTVAARGLAWTCFVWTIIACLCNLTLIAPRAMATVEADLASRIDGFRKDRAAIIEASADADVTSDHSGDLKSAFRRWFPAQSLQASMKTADQAELSDFFYTTFNYLLDTDRAPDGIRLDVVFDALVERGWANDEFVSYMHRYLLTSRRFDEALAFRAAHPSVDLPAPPAIVGKAAARDDHARIVFAMNDDGSALREQVVDIHSSAKVVIIGHPRCHFTQDAVNAISADPELMDALSDAAIWLAAPFTSLTDGVIPEWNRKHPDFAYRYVESKADWPEINYWGTPSFYFMKNGHLVKKVVGWPADAIDERKQALWDGLHAIGAASTQ